VTRTLIVGAEGGDLASEAAVAEALSAFPASSAVVLGHRPARLARALGLRAVFGLEEISNRDFARVVLAGPQRRPETFLAGLAAAAPLVAAGARLAIHNLGLVEDAAMLSPSPEALALLTRADRVSARDHQSQAFMLAWGLPRVPRLAAFPEAAIAPDPALAAALSPRPLLGLALGAREDQAALREGALARLPGLAERLAGFALVPLPADAASVRPAEEVQAIAARLGLPPMPLLLPMACDREAWLRDMTAPRYAGLVRACDAVIAETDFAAALAAEARIPCVALAGVQGNGLHRAVATLADRFAPGSACLMPPWAC
jgi:hypothetical protein